MATYKYIYKHPTQPNFYAVHLLIGYTPNTLESFQEMANKLKEIFPFMYDNKIECGCIHKSNYYDRFSIVAWTGMILPHQLPTDDGTWLFRKWEHMDYWW